MNNIVAGIGDVLLRYPELIDDLDGFERETLKLYSTVPYVAVHLGASNLEKRPPHPELLIRVLHKANIPFMMVGHDSEGPPPKLRMHIEVVKRASAFIGTLSCFNVVAQLSGLATFVLVNRAHKEPFIYGLMDQNGARVEPWNVGKPVEQIYAEAVVFAERHLGRRT